MDILEIIQEIKNRGLTGYKIAESTGLSQVGIDKILNGTTTKPTKKTIEILESYLNNSYLDKNISMFNDSGASYEINKIKKDGLQVLVPYYDVEFTSSFLEVENDQTIRPTSYINHPFFIGCDMVVRNSGQSMAKLIAHGDAVGLIKIRNWKEFFPLGEVYGIVTENNFRMIKIITKGKDDDSYTLISKPTDSKKDEFPPQQIKKSSIVAIFKVQASSHLF